MSNFVDGDTTFADMWSNAAKEFGDRTGEDLYRKPPWTFQDCSNLLESWSQDENESSKAKKIMTNVLEGVRLLGGFVADAAAPACPPAAICFNAVGGLINVAVGVKNFHRMINESFERLSSGLGVMKIHRDVDRFREFHPAFKSAIQRIMISFVRICALSVKLHSPKTRDKLKRTAKIVLLKDDSGLKKAIENFGKLVRDQADLGGAETLRQVMELKGPVFDALEKASTSNQNVLTILDCLLELYQSEKRRSEKEAHKERLDAIRKRLNINEKFDSSTKLLSDLHAKIVPGTAVWFENRDSHPEYAKWSDINSTEANKPVLLVTGRQKTGKSFLMSAICHSLAAASAKKAKNHAKTYVAAYFFPPSTGKGDEKPIETALKCIAYNLASQDEVYQAWLHKNLDHINITSIPDLWDSLNIGSIKFSSNQYIIIDGVPELSPNTRSEYHKILESCCRPDRPRLRVAVSEKPDVVSLSAEHNIINIEDHIGDDMRAVVRLRLKQASFWEENDREQQKLREEIEDRLSTIGPGCFAKATTNIKSICELIKENGEYRAVRKLLRGLNSFQEVKNLQGKRTAKEIAELNELLVWVKHGYQLMDLEMLEGALWVRFHNKVVQSLGKRIVEKYNSVFTVMGSVVQLAGNMSDATNTERTTPRDSDDAPEFSVEVKIRKGNLTSTQSFLWALSGKLAHEGSKWLTKDNAMAIIGVNKWDAHISIIKSTFSLLKKRPQKKTRAIATYMLCYLPDHLEALRKADGINAPSDAIWSEIQWGLVEIFTGDIVKKHWKSCDSVMWNTQPRELSTFRGVLSKPRDITKFGHADQVWIKRVRTDKHPNRFILEKIMRIVAILWLQDSRDEVMTPFKWLEGYFQIPRSDLEGNVIEGNDATSDYAGSGAASDHADNDADSEQADNDAASDDSDDDADSEQADNDAASEQADDDVTHDEPVLSIEAIEKWCRKVLTSENPAPKIREGLWHQRLGETFNSRYRFPDGAKAFLKAIEAGSSSDGCLEGLEDCLYNSDNEERREICAHMEKTLESLAASGQTGPTEFMQKFCFNLARGYGRCKDLKRLAEFTARARESGEENPKSALEALRIYLEFGDDSNAAKLLYGFLGVVDAQETSRQDFLCRMARDRLTLRCLGLLKEDAAALNGFISAITSALDDPYVGSLERTFRLHKGVAHLYLGHITKDQEDFEASRECWDLCFNYSMDRGDRDGCDDPAMLLSAHYFDCAMPKQESDPIQACHVEHLGKFNLSDDPSTPSHPVSYLAACLMADDKEADAESILRPQLESAFCRLSDGVTYNDASAYNALASLLALLGDELNARTALNLVLPEINPLEAMARFLVFKQKSTIDICEVFLKTLEDEVCSWYSMSTVRQMALGILRKRISETPVGETSTGDAARDYEVVQTELKSWKVERQLDISIRCDNCRRCWDFDTDFYLCRYCYDIDFCAGCWGKLKGGQLLGDSLRALTCRPNHKWLMRPRISKEVFLRSLGGRVLVDGKEMEETVWLESLKRKWGYTGTLEPAAED